LLNRKALVVAIAAFMFLLPAIAADASTNSYPSATMAGYQVHGPPGAITRIKGSWVVPAVTCSPGSTSNSTISVMLDGMPSTDMMQIGTVSSCVNGVATYKVFQVMSPQQGKTKVPSIPIKAGDVIEAQGKWSPQTHGWHDQIIDETSGMKATGDTKSPSTFNPGLNAGSFIVSSTGTPLSNFGTAGFGNANTGVKETCIVTAVLSGGTTAHVITLGSLSGDTGFTLFTITMENSKSQVLAQPSALAPDGESFSVTWKQAS